MNFNSPDQPQSHKLAEQFGIYFLMSGVVLSNNANRKGAL